MKLNKLQINGFNILQNGFFIDFDNASNLSIFIGKNGSGKSSILEAVGIIFKSLYKGSKIPFTFVIDYNLEDKHIGIQNIEEFTIRINTNVYSMGELKYFKETQGLDIFPDNIIAYYSGSNERLKKIFNFGKYLESPFLYLENKHFKFILSSLMCSDLERHIEFLRDNFQIEKNENFQMKLKVKLFDKKLIDEISRIDKNFHIHLKESLDLNFLFKVTLDYLYTKEKESGEIKKVLQEIEKIEFIIGSSDLLRYCMRLPHRFKNGLFEFLIDFEEVSDFIYEIGNETNLFKNFLSLSSKGILKDVETSFTKESNIVNYTALSEGEKQLITVIGIKELTTLEESLFLFDEPDTYLHPSWQNTLIEHFSELSNDQILMTTHSAKLLSFVKDRNIFILENGQWLNQEKSTYGRDINWILEYVMYDSSRPKFILDKIKLAYELMNNEKYKDAQNIVNELVNIIGDNDSKLQELQNILFFHMD
ncbi:ATP-binding protein [Aliarcobacter butzleri]|uniref:ATP-binding protein n=1 Tax=Aliarcobacter butzleri TaxID=28197 RepID=UPI0021B498AC|nr:ATP-binding protein [Aliarcobacter butzleri]MCT7553637.1 ATP-binding protein [Aliarcobacter butzleri]